MERIKRTVSVSNILSFLATCKTSFWCRRSSFRCGAYWAQTQVPKHQHTHTHHQARRAPPASLMAVLSDWLAWSSLTKLNTEVFHVHAVDSEPGLMVYATSWFARFVLLDPRCKFTLYMGQVLNIFTCTCTLLYHIMETASGKHNMSQWQLSGPRSSHSRPILELNQVFLYCSTCSWISKCTYFS